MPMRRGKFGTNGTNGTEWSGSDAPPETTTTDTTDMPDFPVGTAPGRRPVGAWVIRRANLALAAAPEQKAGSIRGGSITGRYIGWSTEPTALDMTLTLHQLGAVALTGALQTDHTSIGLDWDNISLDHLATFLPKQWHNAELGGQASVKSAVRLQPMPDDPETEGIDGTIAMTVVDPTCSQQGQFAKLGEALATCRELQQQIDPEQPLTLHIEATVSGPAKRPRISGLSTDAILASILQQQKDMITAAAKRKQEALQRQAQEKASEEAKQTLESIKDGDTEALKDQFERLKEESKDGGDVIKDGGKKLKDIGNLFR